MDERTNQSPDGQKRTEKQLGDPTQIASLAGGCALATLAFGTMLGAPWPAAVVGCAIAAMGVAIAYFDRRC